MTVGYAIYFAREYLGLPSEFSGQAEEDMTLKLAAKAMSNLVRDLQPKTNRIRIEVNGAKEVRLPQGVNYIPELYINGVSVTHQRTNAEALTSPPEED